MDTTKEYVALCNCPEIQDEWEPKVADYVAFEKYGYKKEGLIHLPRQDQYQEKLIALRHPDHDPQERFCAFYLYLDMMDWLRNDLKKPTIIDCNSMEQLWCAFYMKEAHNKTWDGEKFNGTQILS